MRYGGRSVWRIYGMVAVWAVWVGHGLASGAGERLAADAPGIRIAISESIAGEVNGNDLRAAVKAWADEVARQTGVRIVPELCTTVQLVQKVRSHQVDAFSLNFLEFSRIAALADRELVVDETDAVQGVEYILLVQQSGGIRTLADLRGRSLLLHQNPRSCLDRIWLETLLAAAHLGPVEGFLGRVESNQKLSRAVLPVFFGQADACLVTRRGFNTMCDLNPQLARQLRPLAVSGRLMMTFMGFQKDCPFDIKRKFITAATGLHNNVAGRQALMLFGSTRLVQADTSLLRTSFDLLHSYERFKGQTPAAEQ